jgi:hypothetical protein
VVEEALNAGVWVFGGGLEDQKASIVATDRTVTARTRRLSAGSVSSTFPHAKTRWSGLPRTPAPAAAAQEVREFMPDPAVGN